VSRVELPRLTTIILRMIIPMNGFKTLKNQRVGCMKITDYAIVCDEMINDLQLALGGVEAW